MSFVRPTLPDLVVRIQADFVSRLELVGAILRRSMVYVLSRVVAGATHMLHGHLEFLSRQLSPVTAEDLYLVRWASLYGMAKTAPSFAIGLTVAITGTNGTVIPVDTVLVRSDGVEYQTDAEVTIASGTSAPTLTAVVAGADGNAATATVLSFQSPIAGADADVIVGGSGIVNGTDRETTEELRTRLLERIAEPAHGGDSNDYVVWSKEVAGVTRAWVSPLALGPGTVLVRFTRDLDVSPIPDAGEVAAVQAHLDVVAPAHATVTVVAPVDSPQVFTIALTPNTTATRAAATAELDDLFSRESEPGVTMLLSHFRTAIGIATGVSNYVLTVPAADVTHTANQLPSRGTITFV